MFISWLTLVFSLRHWDMLALVNWVWVLIGIPSSLFSLPIHPSGMEGGSTNEHGEAIYGLGVVGASVYYVQHATTFGMGVLGLIKAVFWPPFVIYKAYELLGM